jgi:hypothetical protein
MQHRLVGQLDVRAFAIGFGIDGDGAMPMLRAV